MRPVKQYKKHLHYIDPRDDSIAYLWKPHKLKKANDLKYLCQLVIHVKISGYHGLFKPTWFDVVKALPSRYINNIIYRDDLYTTIEAIEIPEQELTVNNIIESNGEMYHSVIARLYMSNKENAS